MDIDQITEPESSTAYESTTTVDSDDETASSTQANEKFAPPKINRLSSSIRGDQNYADFVKQFQTRLIAIKLGGTQEDLLNFLDHFWEKLKRERNSCFTKSKATKFLCRRINHILLSVRDITKYYDYNPAYFSKVSRILAVYMDLELKASSRGAEYGVTIIERMQHMLCSHLRSPTYHKDNEYVLQTFIHMERLVKSHKELVDLLFNRFIKPKTELLEPEILADRMYITYLVLYRKWIDIETSADFKKKLIEMSKKHILPAQSIRTNLKYAPYLPNWTPNQNPTEVFLTNRMKFSPLIEALKIPDFEDNSDIEIIDFQNVTNIQLEQTQPNSDSTFSITKSLSTTSITNVTTKDKTTKSGEPNRSIGEVCTLPTTSNQTEADKVGISVIIPKKEPNENSLMNQDEVIDLTVDEMDVGNFDDPDLSWIRAIEPKATSSFMLPPQYYGPRKIIDNIIVLDDDEEEEREDSDKSKSNVANENSSDSNLCKFLEKTQTIEISNNNNNNSGTSGTVESVNSGYSMTSPTDSGIIMTNSGRNTVCSLYDEELTDGGLLSNDEREPKSNKQTNNTTASKKSNFINTDTELEMETDSEIENLTESTSKNSRVRVTTGNSDSQLVNNNKDSNVIHKLTENCDELLVDKQNSELVQIESEFSENVTDEAKNIKIPLNQTNFRCGPITKTYQSNKKPRPRMLTPTRCPDVNNSSEPSSIIITPGKSEITLNERPIVLKACKTQINKGAQTSPNISGSTNTGAVVFSMLPRQKPNVLSHILSIPSTNVITNPSTSNNVIFSTVIPTNAPTESTKSVSSSIIKDWTKTEDDLFRTDCVIDSDIEEDGIPPSNILIRCDYFKSEPKSSSSPFAIRPNSPYPIPITNVGYDKMPSSSKNSTSNKTVYSVRRSPASELKKRPSSRNKRVAFAKSVVEYKTEKIEDDKNNLKLRIKKKTKQVSPHREISPPPRRQYATVRKSILKKQPIPKACSVILNKLPESNKHVGDYIHTMNEDSGQERVASILIRRNSTHSKSQPCDTNKKDEGYTVWRRDYVTDYDDVETEQRKSNKKRKSKRKRSRSLSEPRHGSIKKSRKQQIIRLPLIQQFRVIIKPLNLGQLIVDPEIEIQFENELENDNEIYNSFQMNATRQTNLTSTPKSNRERAASFDEEYHAINEPDFVEVDNNNSINEEEITDHEHIPMKNVWEKVMGDSDLIEEDFEDDSIEQDIADEPIEAERIEQDFEDELIEQDIEDELIEHDVEDELIEHDVEDELIEHDVEDELIEHDVEDESIAQNIKDKPNDPDVEDEPNEQVMEEEFIDDHVSNDQNGLLKDKETEITPAHSPESHLSAENSVISSPRRSPEPITNDYETVVSTTHEIHEDIETEIVEEAMEHEIIETNSPLADEILERETIFAKKVMLNESLSESHEMIISQTPEPESNEREPLNISGSSEEILNTNKILSEGSDQAPETFLDRLNVSENSDEIISDMNIGSDTPKSVEQLDTIDRMLSKKPAKVLKANSCLDDLSNSKIVTPLTVPKNGEGENGRDYSLEGNDDETLIDANKNIIVKSSPTHSGEEEYLMEEYIDEDEIVAATIEVAELNNHRSEGEQSCASEEIPSPPFETVISKIDEKVCVESKKVKIEASAHSQLTVSVPIESPPFDEVLDLKSFGTLENDSSISEMENVGKRVNDNFNEIDEEEEIVLSETDIDLNIETESPQPLENQIITSNQNDVTTTTALVQKKKNLVQRPYNRHIKINNKKRNSSSNSSGSDIPETIVSSTTITTNHLVTIANPVEFTGTNNSSTTYNLFCQLNHDDCTMKKRRGRPKGSKNKRKEITPQVSTFSRSNIFQYTPLSPPPALKPVQRRQSVFYQHHEIVTSSPVLPPPMIYNNNPPYRSPYNASEASLNQINRHRSLPMQPFTKHHRINFRSPSCDSDEQPLIHLKQQHHHHHHHLSNMAGHQGYERKHKKIKRNDSNSSQFCLEKQFGTEKDLLDATKTYLKVQEARTIFVPEDIDKLIQNQTTVDPNMKVSPITTTYHRYDPGGEVGGNNGVISNCANILNNSSSSSLSDPITQSHQFVNYDTSSSPERILAQHEHNYSNDSFPHQLPQALLNTSSLDYLHLPYLLTAQQQFKAPMQYIHR